MSAILEFIVNKPISIKIEITVFEISHNVWWSTKTVVFKYEVLVVIIWLVFFAAKIPAHLATLKISPFGEPSSIIFLKASGENTIIDDAHASLLVIFFLVIFTRK